MLVKVKTFAELEQKSRENYEFEVAVGLFSVGRTLFAVVRPVFSVVRLVFAVVRPVFSVGRLVFSVVRPIFSVVRLVVSVVRPVFSVVRLVVSVVRPVFLEAQSRRLFGSFQASALHKIYYVRRVQRFALEKKNLRHRAKNFMI